MRTRCQRVHKIDESVYKNFHVSSQSEKNLPIYLIYRIGMKFVHVPIYIENISFLQISGFEIPIDFSFNFQAVVDLTIALIVNYKTK